MILNYNLKMRLSEKKIQIPLKDGCPAKKVDETTILCEESGIVF